MNQPTPAADRIAPFTTLWDSYTGETPANIAMLFGRAADQIEQEGYDRYSKTEDESSTGITLFEALEQVAREHVTLSAPIYTASSVFLSPEMVKADTASLKDELERRLVGVLFLTGQAYAVTPHSATTEVLWGWTRDAATWHKVGARYRGQAHIVALLRLAAAMTAAIDAG